MDNIPEQNFDVREIWKFWKSPKIYILKYLPTEQMF